MNKRTGYILGLLVLIAGFGIGANSYMANTTMAAVTSAPPAQTAPVTQEPQYTKQQNTQKNSVQQNTTNPLAIVNRPSSYLNKRVTIVARFNKFAALGLDYKPAMRSSETYISFLIFRPDTDKNIPLSEMKLFITRKSAEKLIDLKEGDTIKFSGTVFSTALGDPWLDVDTITKLNTAGKDK